MLVGPEGQRLDLPAEVLGILRVVVDALSEGLAITIARITPSCRPVRPLSRGDRSCQPFIDTCW
jgi:hypothetical protein